MKKVIFLLFLITIAISCKKEVKEVKEDVVALKPAPIIPVEDFFKNSEKRTFRLSPNGEYIAYLAPYENRMNIHVKKFDQDSVTRVTSVTDRD